MPLDTITQHLAAMDQKLWIVTSAAGNRQSGLIATTVMHVSIVPEMPRFLVTIGRQHDTWNQIEASGCLALHLLNDDQLELVWRFGLQSGRDVDKFSGLTLRDGTTGSPILDEAPVWLDCRVENRMDSGDRTVYLAEVIEADYHLSGMPLSVQRMVAKAPADKLDQLKTLRDRDATRDAAAITAWRST